MRWPWLLLLSWVLACDPAGPDLSQLRFACKAAPCTAGHDGGADAGASDAGRADDGGSTTRDAGAGDGGADAGSSADASTPDASTADASTPDAATPDSGSFDGGARDAGSSSSDGGWSWAGVPQHALRSISAAQPDIFWAVGDVGTVLRYSVVGVEAFPAATDRDLHGVWAQGPTVWAVGDRGVSQRFVNGRFVSATTTTTQRLRSVSGTGPNDVWAVGEFGTIQHFDGTVWSSVPSGTNETLFVVRARTPNEAWAGGPNGTLLRWNGSSWAAVVVPTTGTVLGMLLLAPDQLFIATESGAVLERGPSGFSLHSQVGLNVRGLHGTSANDLWAFGMFDQVSRWDGTSWTPVSTPLSTNWLAADGTGSFNLVGEGGAMVRWDNINRFFFSLRDVEPADLSDLLGFADDDVWAVGGDGTVRRFDGGSWATTRLPGAPALQAIAGVSSSDLWATGGSRLFRWMGIAWQQYPALPCNAFSLHARAADDVWGVGALGCAVHWNGTSWTSRSTGLPNVTLRSVLALAPNEVWAVGEQGSAFRFDGTSWSATNTQTTEPLYRVLQTNGALIALGGQFATALRYQQGMWSPLVPPLQGGFRGGLPDGVGFIGVGTPLDTSSAAVVLRYDGTTFSDELTAPVREVLKAAWRSPTGTLWVAGTGGVLLSRPR